MCNRLFQISIRHFHPLLTFASAYNSYQVLKAKQDGSGRMGRLLKGKPLIKVECYSKWRQHLGRDALLSDRQLVGWDTEWGAPFFLCMCGHPSQSPDDIVGLSCALFFQVVGCQLAGRNSWASGVISPKDLSSLQETDRYWVLWTCSQSTLDSGPGLQFRVTLLRP